MGNGRREGEDMRRDGLSKTHVRSVHTRRAERATSTTNRRASPLLRAVAAPPGDRRYATGGSIAVSFSVNGAETVSNKESNDSGGGKRQRNEGRRRGGRWEMEEDGERESGASIGYGYDEDARSPARERMLEHEESDRQDR